MDGTTDEFLAKTRTFFQNAVILQIFIVGGLCGTFASAHYAWLTQMNVTIITKQN